MRILASVLLAFSLVSLIQGIAGLSGAGDRSMGLISLAVGLALAAGSLYLFRKNPKK